MDKTMAQSPSSPIVGRLVDPVRLRGVEDVHLEGDWAFLPCREGKRLTICSIKNPTEPKVVSSFTHPDLDQAAGLAVDGTTAYVASQGNHRLLVLDVRDKSAVRLIASVVVGSPEVRGVLYKVAYRDGYCYVAHQAEKKLFVVDVRDPRRPVVVGSAVVTTEDDGPFSVLVCDGYVLTGTLFGRRNRLAVVDVRSPVRPRLITQVLDPAISQLSGDLVGHRYFTVAWDRNAFLVFDLRDPAHPKLESKLVDERLGQPNRCVVTGDRAYLPMVKGDGVAVVDVTDPRQPRFVSSFRDPVMRKTYGVAARGDLLCVGAREGNSLLVLNRHKLEQKGEAPPTE
ncbi:MAG: hypothetical protein JXQ73_29955 [Phycisphaerae bacterium]|nr:hypothetical protein [Phycisphaerae bacterium]